MILGCLCFGIGEGLFILLGVPVMMFINWIRGG